MAVAPAVLREAEIEVAEDADAVDEPVFVRRTMTLRSKGDRGVWRSFMSNLRETHQIN